MFKFIVIVLLAIIAFSVAADVSVYSVHLPYDINYIAINYGSDYDDIYTINLPFALSSDMFWRIW